MQGQPRPPATLVLHALSGLSGWRAACSEFMRHSSAFGCRRTHCGQRAKRKATEGDDNMEIVETLRRRWCQSRRNRQSSHRQQKEQLRLRRLVSKGKGCRAHTKGGRRRGAAESAAGTLELEQQPPPLDRGQGGTNTGSGSL